MSTLTLTHHISGILGAYWYTLEGTLVDSEGQIVTVSEGTPKMAKVNKTIKFYETNGFRWFIVNHRAKVEE